MVPVELGLAFGHPQLVDDAPAGTDGMYSTMHSESWALVRSGEIARAVSQRLRLILAH